VRLFKLSDYEHLLILALDHLITDGLSHGILIEELWTLYGQAKRGQPFSLPTPTLQFGDFTVWLQRTHGAWLQKHEEYWTERLRDAPSNEIPGCNNSAVAAQPVGIRREISLGHVLSSRLREIARERHTLLPLVVLTIYLAVMSQWCNQRDLVVVFVTHGRCRRELRDVVGFLAHELFLRIEIGREDTFLDLLAKCTLELCTAYEHLNFGRIWELVPKHNTDILFDWIVARGVPLITEYQVHDGEDKLTVVPSSQPIAMPAKFLPLFYDEGPVISIVLNYLPELLTPGAVDWFENELRLFADEFVRDPLCRVEAVYGVSNSSGRRDY